jgi:hypothetical protein
VGGASIVILTDGAFHSGDFDVVASDEALFRKSCSSMASKMNVGRAGQETCCTWSEYPDLGGQLVTGPLFDGRSDQSKGIAIEFKAGSELALPAWEYLGSIDIHLSQIIPAAMRAKPLKWMAHLS